MDTKFWLQNIAVPRHRFKHILQYALADAVVLTIAYLATFSIRIMKVPHNYYLDRAGFILFATCVMIGLFQLFGVYRYVWLRTSGYGISVIVNAVIVATAIILLADLLITPRPLPISVVLFGHILATGGFIGVRYKGPLIKGLLVRKLRWRSPREVTPSTRVLIVGAGETGQVLAWRLQHRSPSTRYHVVGFVDDDPKKQQLLVEGRPVLGLRSQIPALAEQYQVDVIAIAIHKISGPDFREILALCQTTQARIKLIPNTFALVDDKRHGEPLRDIEPEDLIGRSVVSRYEAVDLTPVTHKVILVTGAAGSIGSELCRQLLTYSPTQLIALDNNESGLYDLVATLHEAQPGITITPVLGDITIKESLTVVFRKYPIQVIFHAAAYKHVPMLEYYPTEGVRVNIGGTRNLAELARDSRIERFVLISTDKAVAPTSVMGASKRICELILQAIAQDTNHQTLFTAVRFGNVLGSRGSVLPLFERQIDNGGPVTVTHPEMTRYFMSIPEAVNLVIHAACLTIGGDVFLLKMGDRVRIVELAEKMIRLRGLLPHTDIPIQYTGIRPGEKLNEELCSGNEKPIETLHPGIVKLVDMEPVVGAPELFTRLLLLLTTDLTQPPGALSQLLNFIAIVAGQRVEEEA